MVLLYLVKISFSFRNKKIGNEFSLHGLIYSVQLVDKSHTIKWIYIKPEKTFFCHSHMIRRIKFFLKAKFKRKSVRPNQNNVAIVHHSEIQRYYEQANIECE